MTLGTALFAIVILLLIMRTEVGRLVALAVFALLLGAGAFLIDFGSDKPQTLFYNYSAHPAFKMATGDTCPPDRHVWNGWCVK